MALIINNAIIPCEAHVIDWRSSGLEFTPNSPNCGIRKKAPRLFITHFTGAENAPPKMFKNMLAGKVAVEFAMDYYGCIWQFCDPAKVFTAHAAGANLFSFGMEIQSRGTPKGGEPQVPDADFPRGVTQEKMEWGNQRYVTFTADQLTALEQFIDALTSVKFIPEKLAMPKKDIRKRIPKSQWPMLEGVAGHYHCDLQDSSAKIDPGPQIFDELYDHFEMNREMRREAQEQERILRAAARNS